MNLDSYSNRTWTADEFVSTVNRLLPEFLPEAGHSQKVREEVNLRLIRHYTSMGALDEPGKQGKEARYCFRHLLQMLLVRRLLAQGYSSGSIDEFPRLQSDQQLLVLLKQNKPPLANLLHQEGRQAASESALSFLDSVRKKTVSPGRSVRAHSHSANNPWSRIPLCPGLELNIQAGFVPPKGSELVALIGHITEIIKNGPT